MVRSMNRIDRMLATILLLQSRRVTKAEDIAGHFEISLRTVYRDIAALGEAGVPIVAEAGVGYGLLKGYSVPPVMFTAEEAGALFLGGEMVGRLTDPSLQSPVSSALLKIRSVLPRAQQDHLDRLEKATALFVPSGKTRQAPQAVLAQIQRALAQRRVLSIDYLAAGREEPTPRDVEPLGLIYYSDRWHLIAYCRLRQDYRDFRTDRMQDLRVRNVAFAGHEGVFCPRVCIVALRVVRTIRGEASVFCTGGGSGAPFMACGVDFRNRHGGGHADILRSRRSGMACLLAAFLRN